MKTQLAQLQQKQTFLKILIFTLVTVMVWVGLTLFRTQQRTGITPELLKMAEALNPNINEAVLSEIEQKRAYSPEELNDFPIYSITTDRTGEQQLVVFSASDRQRRQVQENVSQPTEQPQSQPETQQTQGGSSISIESAQQETPPAPETTPEQPAQ